MRLFNTSHLAILLIAICLSAPSLHADTLSIPVRPTTFPLNRPTNSGTLVSVLTDGKSQEYPGGTNIVQAAVSYNATYGLKNNGQISAWVYSYSYGSIPPYPGATNVVQLAGSGYHQLALRADGTVLAWGNNSVGETDVPKGLTNVVQIAAGNYSSLALKSDGTVVAWGLQSNVPSGLTNVVQIASSDFSAALKDDGTVVAWGANNYGQTNVPAGLTNVVQIALGLSHALALKNDGTVVTWGYPYVKISKTDTNIVGLSVQDLVDVGLKSDGGLIFWKKGYYENTNPINSTVISKAPYQIVAGETHTVALVPTKKEQTLTGLDPIPEKTYGNAPFSIKIPTASSRLPVGLSVNGPATLISSNMLRIDGAGTVTLTATQTGNNVYYAASEDKNFVVNKANQTIDPIGKLPTIKFGAPDFVFSSPKSSSSLPVILTVDSGPVYAFATGTNYSTNYIRPLSTGIVNIRANQHGNSNYNEAPTVRAVLLITKGDQKLTPWGTISQQTFVTNNHGANLLDFSAAAPTASSGYPVSFKVKSGPAKTNTGKASTTRLVLLTGKGTVVLSAVQGGDKNYNASPEVTTSFQVK